MQVTRTGTVKLFKTENGYGFIVPDDGSADVFVHVNELMKSGINGLDKGDRVSFEVHPSKKDPKKFAAANVKMVN